MLYLGFSISPVSTLVDWMIWESPLLGSQLQKKESKDWTFEVQRSQNMEPVEELLESEIVKNGGKLLPRPEQVVLNDKISTQEGVIFH